MFNPPPEEEPSPNNKTQNNSSRKKKKSSTKKLVNKLHHNHRITKKKAKFAATMSSWAENFTVAATWQLKHQLAYWKAKATSLDYENKVLHDIIRKNYLQSPSGSKEQHCQSVSGNEVVPEAEDIPAETYEDNEMPNNDDEDEFVVSEEFIEFLRSNAKYKEDARQERERFKANNDASETTDDMEASPSKKEDPSVLLKRLYGAKWQEIGALEISLHSEFINESDKEKPAYWPNIPFNFNFS